MAEIAYAERIRAGLDVGSRLMREREFQGWVIDLFRAHGWTVKHVPTPMRPLPGGKFVPDSRGRGLPDLLMIHPDPPRLVFAECKVDSNPLSDEQRDILFALRAVSDRCDAVGAYIFRPGVEPLIEAIARGAEVAA